MSSNSFRYLTLDRNGKQQKIEIQAENTAEARLKLKKQGLIPLKELKISGKKQIWLKLNQRRNPKRKFDVLDFVNRLAPLLAANVPLEKALNVMSDSAINAETAEILREFRRNLQQGKSFSDLIQEKGDLFPPVVAGLIRTGEESGCLPMVVNELRNFLMEQRDFHNFVVTSSIYPQIVASVTLGVVLLLFTVFVPQFAQVFEDMGAELPTLTRYMLSISNFITGNWLFLVLLCAVQIMLIRRAGKPGILKNLRDKFLLKLPVAGPLIISVQISTFLQAMSIMTRSHVHLLSALKLAQQLISNVEIRRGFESVSEQIRGGEKLSDVFAQIIYLPPGSPAMLKVAEESGEVGEMFHRLFQEEQSSTRLKFKRLLAMLEPLIIMVLAVMVMAVVLAVFMAIWKMNSIR